MPVVSILHLQRALGRVVERAHYLEGGPRIRGIVDPSVDATLAVAAPRVDKASGEVILNNSVRRRIAVHSRRCFDRLSTAIVGSEGRRDALWRRLDDL